jgi:hypothetical protein
VAARHAQDPYFAAMSAHVAAYVASRAPLAMQFAWLSRIEHVSSRVQYHVNHDEEWHDLESFKQAIGRVWESVTSDTY